MPGNPDATPEPSDRPSWLNDVVLDVLAALDGNWWMRNVADGEREQVAAAVTTHLWLQGRLKEPEGFREPTDEELGRQAEEALAEWPIAT